ncbi:hypothetical protein ACFL47_09580 [Candidatus Latescibacterota bacterium]
MKTRKSILLFCTVLVMITCYSCKPTVTDFTEIAQFKPDDKHFTTSLKGLHFLTETSAIPRVDTLFTQMITVYDLPVTAHGCKDGVYTGESPWNAYDYKNVAKVKIKGGKIVSIDYDEVHYDGHGKQDDREYNKEMSITGTTPAEAYLRYENQLLKSQDINEVDGVTGASYSLYRFKYAVIMALIKASL